MGKKVVMAYFKALPRNVGTIIEEKDVTLKPPYAV
jgi:hypothetical protein